MNKAKSSIITQLFFFSLLVVFTLAQVSANNNAECVPGQPNFNCSYKAFKAVTTEQACQIIAKNCCGAYIERFNFFIFLYCDLKDQLFAFVLLSIVLIYLIFRFISATVDEYIAGGITVISEYLGMSESMAAVTLLAFANGAGEMITAIVSSGAEAGLSYNIGSLFGAGFFVFSIIIAITILKSPGRSLIQVNKSTIYRDAGFYILVTVMILIFALTQYIYWWSALIMLLIYFLMVAVVYFQGKFQSQEEQPVIQNSLLEEAAKTKKSIYEDQDEDQKPKQEVQLKKRSFEDEEYKQGQTSSYVKLSSIVKSSLRRSKKYRQSGQPGSLNQSINKDESFAFKEGGAEDEDEDVPWGQMSFWQKVDYVLDFPFDWIRRITMPPSEKKGYDKLFCIIWPFAGSILLLCCMNLNENTTARYIALASAITLSCLFYYTQKDLQSGQVPIYFPLISIISTIWGLLWTYIISQLLIDLLNVYCIRLNLDETFMGLTIIGVGNALPDGLTTVAIAMRGYPQMAITGAYAGQLFALLIGFGVAQLKETLINGPQRFDLFKQPERYLLELLVICSTLFCLIFTSIYVISSRYSYKRNLAWLLIIFYLSFFGTAVAVQIYYIIHEINHFA